MKAIQTSHPIYFDLESKKIGKLKVPKLLLILKNEFHLDCTNDRSPLLIGAIIAFKS